jgi:pentapeptide MXKDX repeat protein
MKMKYAMTTFAALAFVVAGSMYVGAASAEDTMKSETPAQDHMKGDAMKSGHAGDDAMSGTQK